MTLITFSENAVVMRNGKVGTEQSCCCGGCDNCFVDFSGVYSFTFTGTCNGNPVNMAGFITDGLYFNVPDVVTLLCTQFAPCNAGAPVAGLLLSVTNGNCTWEAIVPGDTETVCPADQVTIAGTYNLTNCADNTVGTLVIV